MQNRCPVRPKSFVAAKLKAARRLKGLNPDSFAFPIGKSGRSILNWETGKTSPTIKDLEAICEHYGFAIEYFLTAEVA